MCNNANLKILFLSAEPRNMIRLRLGQELRDIQEKLNLSNCQGQFILSHCMAARPTDITQALLDSTPNIVHFSGHGLDTGELCFENNLGEMEPVKPDVLADLFKLVSDQTNCVLLNSCYSKILAEAIVKHISYVIGMNQSIGDKAAIAFATGFYKAIGAGHSVDKAFKFECIEIRLKGISEYQIPKLLTRKRATTLKDVQKVQWELKLSGTLTNETKHKADAIVAKLCEILGDSSLTLKKVERGSIKLSLEGSQEEFEIFKELFESGRLKEILGNQIESVQSSDLEALTNLPDENSTLILGREESVGQAGTNRIATHSQESQGLNRLESNELDSLLQALSQKLRKLPQNRDNSHCLQLLGQALPLANREEDPETWAYLHGLRGNCLLKAHSGDRAATLEQAIEAYKQALNVMTRDMMPDEWADVSHNLANAYVMRIQGDRADNIDQAIVLFEQALLERTQEYMPLQWAQTTLNLAGTYVVRIRGDRSQNIEKAIELFIQLQAEITQEVHPIVWAGLMSNLGMAYFERIAGNRAENIEQAIKCFRQSLAVTSLKEANCIQWSDTANNLGVAYDKRLRGDRAENLESAIDHLEQALEIRTPEAMPIKWAETSNNLAMAYADRILGDHVDNLERAISLFRQVEKVRSQEEMRFERINTLLNLGVSYWKVSSYRRIEDTPTDDIEQAIECFNQALNVVNQTIEEINRTSEEVIGGETFHFKWAGLQNNLGMAYLERSKGEPADNIARAIEHFEQAQTVMTQEKMPFEWANIMNNIGRAYLERRDGDRGDNIQQAIRRHCSALSVFNPEQFSLEYAETQLGLGTAYQAAQRWQDAYEAFATAIRSVENLRTEIRSGDEAKQKLAEKWNHLYQRMVVTCLELKKEVEAIEYVERSKTRNLVELILSRDLHTLFPADVVGQLQQLEDEIDTNQNKIQTATANDPTAVAQDLMQSRQQRNELQNRYLRVGASFRFDQLQSILNERTTIIEWFITEEKILAFIIKPHPLQGQAVSVWQSTTADIQALLDWTNAYLEDYSQPNKDWGAQLTLRLEQLAKILHLDELIQQLPQACQQLILIPHRFLHLFPLHALPISHNGKTVCLLDCFPKGVSYAPSCQLLQQAQQRKRPNFTHLFAIQNPTNDLISTDLEVQAIAGYFNPVNIFKHETATLAAINDDKVVLNTTHCAHFSCHGYFNPANPHKSALILADAPLTDTSAQSNTKHYLKLRQGKTLDLNQCLTLDAILDLSLEYCRLVTLSACETGLIDLFNTSDEYIGLPSGFLVAGSPSVVSSLWRVDDLSTAFLMIRFYKNLKAGMSIALALNQAQCWLRQVTKRELEHWCEHEKLELNDLQSYAFDSLLHQKEDKHKPFQNPFYWAAFCAVGQ